MEVLRYKIWILICSVFLLGSCNNKDTLVKNHCYALKPKTEIAVVFFISGDCPLCKIYKPLIKNFGKSLPSTWETFAVRMDMENKGRFFPGEFGRELGDNDKEVSHIFGATITPQVFIFNAKSEILYSGAIDNYAIEPGRHRPKATEFYLKDAVSYILDGQTPKITTTEAIGCFIE